MLVPRSYGSLPQGPDLMLCFCFGCFLSYWTCFQRRVSVRLDHLRPTEVTGFLPWHSGAGYGLNEQAPSSLLSRPTSLILRKEETRQMLPWPEFRVPPLGTIYCRSERLEANRPLRLVTPSSQSLPSHIGGTSGRLKRTRDARDAT